MHLAMGGGSFGSSLTPLPPPPHVPSSHKAIISRYQGFKLCEV